MQQHRGSGYRPMKSGISDDQLAELVMTLRQDARLCHVSEDESATEPQVICSLGLRKHSGGLPCT